MSHSSMRHSVKSPQGLLVKQPLQGKNRIRQSYSANMQNKALLWHAIIPSCGMKRPYLVRICILNIHERRQTKEVKFKANIFMIQILSFSCFWQYSQSFLVCTLGIAYCIHLKTFYVLLFSLLLYILSEALWEKHLFSLLPYLLINH